MLIVCLVYDHLIKFNDTHSNPCGKGGEKGMRKKNSKTQRTNKGSFKRELYCTVCKKNFFCTLNDKDNHMMISYIFSVAIALKLY